MCVFSQILLYFCFSRCTRALLFALWFYSFHCVLGLDFSLAVSLSFSGARCTKRAPLLFPLFASSEAIAPSCPLSLTGLVVLVGWGRGLWFQASNVARFSAPGCVSILPHPLPYGGRKFARFPSPSSSIDPNPTWKSYDVVWRTRKPGVRTLRARAGRLRAAAVWASVRSLAAIAGSRFSCFGTTWLPRSFLLRGSPLEFEVVTVSRSSVRFSEHVCRNAHARRTGQARSYAIKNARGSTFPQCTRWANQCAPWRPPSEG